MSEPVERLEVDVAATTAAYLRRRCARRGDLAGAAAAALHDLAVRDAAASLARYHGLARKPETAGQPRGQRRSPGRAVTERV